MASCLHSGARMWTDARVIHARRGWDDLEGEQATKTKARVRDVPVLAPLRPLLAARSLALTPCDLDPLVFVAASIGRSRSTLTLLAERDAAGLEPIGLHEARHTYASTLIAAGANIKVVEKCMGHATIAMTLDRYAQPLRGGLDEAAAADAFLGHAPASTEDTPSSGRPGLSGPLACLPACPVTVSGVRAPSVFSFTPAGAAPRGPSSPLCRIGPGRGCVFSGGCAGHVRQAWGNLGHRGAIFELSG